MRRFIALVGLGVVTSLACTHPQTGSGDSGGRSVITRDDMDRIHAATALDAVQRYRADVLVTRAPSSIYLNKQQHPVVFMDSQLYGQIDELRNIAADGIKEIRLFSASDAVRLFGAQYGGGVIQIVSRGGA